MTLPLARAAGNMARANPRLYSTHTEPAFTHRSAPPLPSLDHLVQPQQDFVSLLSHKIHSVLGTALYTLRQPLWMPKFEAAVQPLRVAVETPEAVAGALTLAHNEEHGWKFYEEERYERSERPMARWMRPQFKGLPQRVMQRLGLAPAAKSVEFDLAYAPLAADVASVAYQTHQNTFSFSEYENASAASRPSLFDAYAKATEQPRLALIRIPVDRPSLDGGQYFNNTPLPPSLQYVPAPTPSERAQLIASAVFITGIAVVTATASLTAFLKGKFW